MNDSILTLNINNLKIENGTNIKNLISQIQNYTKPLLSVVNDTYIEFFIKNDQIPKNIKYIDHTPSKTSECDQYNFLDITTNKHYCVFGLESAKLFCPNFDNKVVTIYQSREHSAEQYVEQNKEQPVIIKYIGRDDKNIIIYEKGKKYEFPYVNKMIEIKTNNIFEN